MAGWVAVALLAIAGFAAFGNPGPSPQQVRLDAVEESMGHTAGAYAGLGFTQMGVVMTAAEGPGEDFEDSSTGSTVAEDETGVEVDSTGVGGTVVDPGTGWLSEVEVRALVSLYFDPADVNRAVRVAWCESRFDPESASLRTGGVGIFQHLPQYWEERVEQAGFAGAEPTDPEASIAAAAWAIYQGGGWDVFACQG
jgi:hypothetical protein